MYNYEEFKKKVAAGEQIPNYYENLIYLSKDIMIDLAYNQRKVVAKELGMSYTKFTFILPILKVLAKDQ